jgi:hypothetical protein
MGTELLHAEGQMDGQMDMMKLIVTFTEWVIYICHRECRKRTETFAQ